MPALYRPPPDPVSGFPNPILAADEDFGQSPLKAGLAYPQRMERIIRTGLETVRE